MTIFSSRQPHRIQGIFCCWCLAICVLASFSRDAFATCGDYLLVGNPRVHPTSSMGPGSHEAEESSDTASRSQQQTHVPEKSSPAPCHGSECRSAPSEQALSIVTKVTIPDFAQHVKSAGQLPTIPDQGHYRADNDRLPVDPFLEAPVPPPRRCA